MKADPLLHVELETKLKEAEGVELGKLLLLPARTAHAAAVSIHACG